MATPEKRPTPSVLGTVLRATAAEVPGGGAATVLFDYARDLWGACADEFAGDVEAGLAGRIEDLHAALDRDPAIEYVFVNAYEAAVRGSLRAKRRLLAKVVAESVIDPTLIDEHTLVVQALRDIDVVHVRALRRLSDEWEEAKTGASTNPNGVSWGNSNLWSGQGEDRLPDAIKAVLVRTGTAWPARPNLVARSGPPRRVEGISDFGLRLLEQLRQEGLDDDA